MTNRPVTHGDLERLLSDLGGRLGDLTQKAVARYHETVVVALRDEVHALRAEVAGLKAPPVARAAGGVRHRFTEVRADPADPGAALLMLEDGSSVRVRREQAARWHDAVAGRA